MCPDSVETGLGSSTSGTLPELALCISYIQLFLSYVLYNKTVIVSAESL